MAEIDAGILRATIGQADTLAVAINGAIAARAADPLATTGVLNARLDGPAAPATGEPTQLGRFAVLRRIGAGGMGMASWPVRLLAMQGIVASARVFVPRSARALQPHSPIRASDIPVVRDDDVVRAVTKTVRSDNP